MKKEISLKNFLLIMVVLVIIEAFIMCYIIPKREYKLRKKEIETYCKLAACNEDLTICYNYSLDESGHTIVTWRGSCKLD